MVLSKVNRVRGEGRDEREEGRGEIGRGKEGREGGREEEITLRGSKEEEGRERKEPSRHTNTGAQGHSETLTGRRGKQVLNSVNR